MSALLLGGRVRLFALLLLAGATGFLLLRAWVEADEERAAREGQIERIAEAFEVRRDPGEALRLAAEGIERWPEDGRFELWRARALAARGRYARALEAYASALERLGGAEEPRWRLERARVRWRLYRDTHEREQFQLAEADVVACESEPELEAEAHVLHGLLLAERGAPGDAEEALRLLERGLGRLGEPVVLEEEDIEQARETLDRLRGR